MDNIFTELEKILYTNVFLKKEYLVLFDCHQELPNKYFNLSILKISVLDQVFGHLNDFDKRSLAHFKFAKFLVMIKEGR